MEVVVFNLEAASAETRCLCHNLYRCCKAQLKFPSFLPPNLLLQSLLQSLGVYIYSSSGLTYQLNPSKNKACVLTRGINEEILILLWVGLMMKSEKDSEGVEQDNQHSPTGEEVNGLITIAEIHL